MNLIRKRILSLGIELCNLYNVDEEKLVEMWLGYSTSVFNEVDITLDRLIKLEHDLLKKENKSNNVNRNGEFLNTRSIVTDPLKQIMYPLNLYKILSSFDYFIIIIYISPYINKVVRAITFLKCMVAMESGHQQQQW